MGYPPGTIAPDKRSKEIIRYSQSMVSITKIKKLYPIWWLLQSAILLTIKSSEINLIFISLPLATISFILMASHSNKVWAAFNLLLLVYSIIFWAFTTLLFMFNPRLEQYVILRRFVFFISLINIGASSSFWWHYWKKSVFL